MKAESQARGELLRAMEEFDELVQRIMALIDAVEDEAKRGRAPDADDPSHLDTHD